MHANPTIENFTHFGQNGDSLTQSPVTIRLSVKVFPFLLLFVRGNACVG